MQTYNFSNMMLLKILIAVLILLGTGCTGNKPANLVENWKVGASTGILNDFSQESFNQIKAAGVDYIEMGSAVFRDKSLQERKAFVADIKEKADRAGVQLWSVHMPFGRIQDISTLNDEDRESMLRECKEIFELWQPMNPRKFVIHPSAEPISDEEREQRIANSIASLKILTEEMKKYPGSSLALENLPRTCLGNTSAELLRIVNAVGNGLEVCYDSNHMLQESPEEFLANLGSLITTVHMSDYGYVDGRLDERHWLPGEGIINWTNVISELVKAGFQGPFLFETSMRKPDPETNVRARLSPQELVTCWQDLRTAYIDSH
jgi:sugar phosphate isomerase/epimerase